MFMNSPRSHHELCYFPERPLAEPLPRPSSPLPSQPVAAGGAGNTRVTPELALVLSGTERTRGNSAEGGECDSVPTGGVTGTE